MGRRCDEIITLIDAVLDEISRQATNSQRSRSAFPPAVEVSEAPCVAA
jgi:hypothetical protein